MTVRLILRLAGLLVSIAWACNIGKGQDLTPRAYVITPIHSNAVVITNSFFSGELNFNGVVPITDSTAKVNVPILSIYHSFNLLGRSANFTASLPYGVGNFKGTVSGSETNAYRSGLFDSVFRFAANLKGGPAMDIGQFRSYRQKTVLGASIRVQAPTGQYDSRRLINYGANRWAFKPELGYSRRLRKNWILDGQGGVWIFTRNPEFFSRNAFVPYVQAQTQEPIVALEGHLSYDLKPRMWISLDANFWYGGRTSLNGVENPTTLQRNSRIGATGSLPLTRAHSIKMSYSHGTVIRYGGNFHNFSAAWQYSWLGRPN